MRKAKELRKHFPLCFCLLPKPDSSFFLVCFNFFGFSFQFTKAEDANCKPNDINLDKQKTTDHSSNSKLPHFFCSTL